MSTSAGDPFLPSSCMSDPPGEDDEVVGRWNVYKSVRVGVGVRNDGDGLNAGTSVKVPELE